MLVALAVVAALSAEAALVVEKLFSKVGAFGLVTPVLSGKVRFWCIKNCRRLTFRQ